MRATRAEDLLTWSPRRSVHRSYLESDDPDVRRLAHLTQEAVEDVRRLIMTSGDDHAARDRALAGIYGGLAAARQAYAEPRGLLWEHPGRR